VDLGPALVADAFVPGPTRVHAVEFAAKIVGIGLAGDDFIGIAGQIGDAVGADAFGLAAVAHPLPQTRELLGIARGDLLHVRAVPLDVAQTLVGVAHIAVGERQHLGALAGERPFGLRAHALADCSALDLGLMKAIHHLRTRALFVRPGVGIHTVAFVYLLALADRLGLELFTHGLLVGFVVPALFALVVDVGAVVAIDQLHAGRAGGIAGIFLGLLLRLGDRIFRGIFRVALVRVVSRFGAVSALCVASAGNASLTRNAGSRSIDGAGLVAAQPTKMTMKSRGNRIAGGR